MTAGPAAPPGGSHGWEHSGLRSWDLHPVGVQPPRAVPTLVTLWSGGSVPSVNGTVSMSRAVGCWLREQSQRLKILKLFI